MGEKVCALLDRFAILIQILLGTIAFSTLIYKRHRERPQRPVKIWLFDVSKQVIGACMMHGLNLFASLIAGENEQEITNPCVWYFLNIFLDCTLGVFILFTLLKLLHKGASSLGVQGVRSGDYGMPPRVTWWLKQLSLFIIGLFTMKTIVVLLIHIAPFLFKLGEWSIHWTESDPKLQIVFVMLIFPLIMNIVQFWLVDQVIKKRFEHIKLDNPSDAFAGEDDVFLHREYSLDGDSPLSPHHRYNTSDPPTASLNDDDKENNNVTVVITKQNPRGSNLSTSLSKPSPFQNFTYTTASSNTPDGTGSGRGRSRGRGSNSGLITIAGKNFDISPTPASSPPSQPPARKKIEIDNVGVNNFVSTQQFEDAEEPVSLSKGRIQQSQNQKMKQNNKTLNRDGEYASMIISLVKDTIVNSKNTENLPKTKSILMKSPGSPDKKQSNAEALSIMSKLINKKKNEVIMNGSQLSMVPPKVSDNSQLSSIVLPKVSDSSQSSSIVPPEVSDSSQSSSIVPPEVSEVSLKQDQDVTVDELYQLAVAPELDEDDEAKKTWQAKITAKKKKISSATIVPHTRRQLISDEMRSKDPIVKSMKLKAKSIDGESMTSGDDGKKEESTNQQSKDDDVSSNGKLAKDNSPILLDTTIQTKISSKAWKWDKNKAAELFPDFLEPISGIVESGEAQKRQLTRNQRLNQMSELDVVTFDQLTSNQYDRTRGTYPRRGGYRGGYNNRGGYNDRGGYNGREGYNSRGGYNNNRGGYNDREGYNSRGGYNNNRGNLVEGNRNQFRGGGMNRQTRRPTNFQFNAQAPENMQFTSSVDTEFNWSHFNSKYPPVQNYFLKSAAKLSPIERAGLKLEIIGGDYHRYLNLSPATETTLKEIKSPGGVGANKQQQQKESIAQTVKSMSILLDDNTSYSYSIDKKTIFLGTFMEGMQGRFRTLLPPTAAAAEKVARK
ncbi:3381_t:CDS:2 [Ambispora gerdemannii]|uniref:3381_t:CDS:1 n=1 Tax=Ambispora gerdemannii TaxID=144530 RepID=A0A9N9EXN7_9GLOM|nr:3381_t:CDS:2 [Ambispora gerdemannii]